MPCYRTLIAGTFVVAIVILGIIAPAMAASSTILEWVEEPPDGFCPGDSGQYIEVCARLEQRCSGGEKEPLEGREILFFVNPGNCGVDVAQNADDSVFTNADGIACGRVRIPGTPGKYNIRVKFRGEDKPDPCPSVGNSACDPEHERDSKRCVELSSSNLCHAFGVSDEFCCAPPVVIGPRDTTVEVCQLPVEICTGPWTIDCPGGDRSAGDKSGGGIDLCRDLYIANNWSSAGKSGSDGEHKHGELLEGEPQSGGACRLCFTADSAGSYVIVACFEGNEQIHGCCGLACDTVVVRVVATYKIVCPPDVTVECQGSTDPNQTGFARFEGCLAGDSVTWRDARRSGRCAQENTIFRTWYGIVNGIRIDSCRQEIAVQDTVAPRCRVPNDTAYFLCEPGARICLPVGATDQCDQDVLCRVVNGPGEITNGIWCYAPTRSGKFTVAVACEDDCGNRCDASFNVDVVVNRPPVCNVPEDVVVNFCEPAEIRLPVSATDPDGNLRACEIVEGPGRIENGYWTYTPRGNEAHCITIRCLDECGSECRDRFCVVININEGPTCQLPNDTTISLCNPAEICLPVGVVTPAKEVLPVPGCGVTSGPGVVSDGYWCWTPPDHDTTVTVVIGCTDTCGAGCDGSFTVAIAVNAPPVCEFRTPSSPLCTPPIVFVPFGTSDPDGDNVTCRLDGPGELTEAGWQYFPTPGEQIAVRIVCSDPCGDSCEVSWEMSFPARVPPICNVPNDTTIALCAGTGVSLPVSVGGGGSCEIMSGPGTLSLGYWNYTPTTSGTVDVAIRCISESQCDSCSDAFSVTFEIISSPEITFAGDRRQEFFLCSQEPICLPYTATDGQGGNNVQVTVVSGPGSVDAQNSRICFIPSGSGQVTIIARATDACGSAEDTVTVVVDLNDPPVCELPADTAILMCEAFQVCLPVTANDPDGNLLSCEIKSGPGQIIDGKWCYVPDGPGGFVITVTCTDECGATCEGSFAVDFTVNGLPPVCSGPNDTMLILCGSEEICLPITVSDPDGDLAACLITNGPGELRDGNWCYTPPAEGEAVVTVRCIDACGFWCERTFTVIYDFNDPPTLSAPELVTREICGPQTICFNISSSDRNGNLVECILASGPGQLVGSEWCYSASGRDETMDLVFQCTDECGLIAQRQVHVVINGSEVPICGLPADQRFILCEPGELCLPIHPTDPTVSGVVCEVVDGVGEVRGNNWCYNVTAPEQIVVSVRCTNSCGDVCTATRNYILEIDPRDCDGIKITAGDLNRSGDLNVQDLTLMARLLYHSGSREGRTAPSAAAARPGYPAEADVNCDSRFNESDLQFLSDHIFRNGPAPCLVQPSGIGPRPGHTGESRNQRERRSGGGSGGR